MAVAPLIIQIRAAGQRALTNLSTGMRRLAANTRVAYRQFVIAGGLAGALSRSLNRLARNANQAARAMLRFAASSALAGLSRMLDGVGNSITSVAAGLTKFAAIAAVAAAVVVPLVGVLGNLLPLTALVAPAAFAAVPALAALGLAFRGVGTALGAAGDPKKFAEALKKLTPAAQSAVRTLVDLGKEWSRTRKLVQESFFTNFRNDAIGVSRAIQPLADKWLPRIAGSFRDLRTFLANGLATAAKDGRLEGIMRNVSLALDNITRAAGSFAKAFGSALVGSSPLFERMTSAIATGAEKFAVWLDEAQKSGKLAEWLDKAVDTFKQLKELAGNLGGIIAGIFKGGDGGEGFLDTLISATQRMEDFIKSADGQAMIKFFNTVISAVAATEPAWALMLGQINNTKAAFGFLADAAGEAWKWIKTQVLIATLAIVGQLGAVVTAAAWAFGWIPGLGDKLRSAKAGFDDFVNGVNNALNNIHDKTVTITYRAVRIGDHMVSGSQLRGDYSSGIGGRASGGPVKAGRPYLVGEEGPELITPTRNGYVHTADATRHMAAGGGGGGGGSWNILVAPGPGAAGNPLVDAVLSMIRNGQVRLIVDRSGKVVPA